jgi:cell division protein FtsL
MIVFAALFGAVVSSTWRVQSQQHLDDLDAKVTAAQTRYEQLRLEVAQLDSPARIVDVATHRLGMVQPGSTTYLLPPPNDDTTPTTADPASAVPDESAQGDWTDVKPYLGAAP